MHVVSTTTTFEGTNELHSVVVVAIKLTTTFLGVPFILSTKKRSVSSFSRRLREIRVSSSCPKGRSEVTVREDNTASKIGFILAFHMYFVTLVDHMSILSICATTSVKVWVEKAGPNGSVYTESDIINEHCRLSTL